MNDSVTFSPPSSCGGESEAPLINGNPPLRVSQRTLNYFEKPMDSYLNDAVLFHQVRVQRDEGVNSCQKAI